MELLSSGEIKLKRIAAILGILQGLAWTIMSLLCIVMYNKESKPSIPSSYMDEVDYSMYWFYLSDNIPFNGQSITTRVFTGFMWVYLFVDIIWALVSLYVMIKKGYRVKSSLKAWSFITLIVCLLDFLLVILLGADYQKCLDRYKYVISFSPLEANCANGILPVLVIAAKGFILWIVNVSLATVLLQIATRLKHPRVIRRVSHIGYQVQHADMQLPVNSYARYLSSRANSAPIPRNWNSYPQPQDQFQHYQRPVSLPRRY